MTDAVFNRRQLAAAAVAVGVLPAAAQNPKPDASRQPLPPKERP